ncbi:LicD family protein [Lachnospiraceae bacterium JLR.KK008]
MVELNAEALHKIQMIELEMLIEVDRICKKHDIKYTIIGGTLLGAVRDGNFIPWDDDADVAMLRREYEKFCKAAAKDLDSGRFYFQNMDNTPGYRWGYAKIRRRDTLFLRRSQERMPYEQGVFLDIFPIDATPDNLILRRIHELCCFFVRKTLWSAIGRLAADNAVERLLYGLLYRIPEDKVKRMYRRLILKHGSETTEVVRTLTYPAPKPLHGYYRRWFAETAPIRLAGVLFEGVKDYEGWLRYEFGDYMTLPPKKKRKAHPVSAIRLIDVPQMTRSE